MGRLTCWTPLVVLAVFLSQLQTSAACTCQYRHPQTKFCKSDFVALVTVEEFAMVNETSATVAYKVNVNQTFKATPSAQIAMDQKPLWLWTRSNSGLCGVLGLTPGETWVVGGGIDGSQPHIWSCGLVMLWSNVTPRQRDNFRQFYQHGCDCQISYKFDESADNKTCYMWERPKEENDCQERYDICMLGSEGCSWTPCIKTA